IFECDSCPFKTKNRDDFTCTSNHFSLKVFKRFFFQHHLPLFFILNFVCGSIPALKTRYLVRISLHISLVALKEIKKSPSSVKTSTQSPYFTTKSPFVHRLIML